MEIEFGNVKKKYNKQIEIELIVQEQQLESAHNEIYETLKIYENTKSEQNDKIENAIYRYNALSRNKNETISSPNK